MSSALLPQTHSKQQYHIGLKPGDLSRYILLCGDPDRVEKTYRYMDEYRQRGMGYFRKHRTQHREYVSVQGHYRGFPVSVVATGIGPDNTEIAVIEISQIVKKPCFIRIGSCGALQKFIRPGDLVITERAFRGDRVSDFYMNHSRWVEADPGVVRALTQAAENFGFPYHCGGTYTANSFYAGQFRSISGFPALKQHLRKSPVGKKHAFYNFEMETSALLTLSKVSTLGLRAGSVCAVYAHRLDNTFLLGPEAEAAERRCIRTGLEAFRLLSIADRR
ncbi:MAG: nucleoside phosphorylase [Elusimicrobia bacterium]|nr:nucleoside phosphorylase [Elusimicrobiota bacterium]